jgi:hypothetical protein
MDILSPLDFKIVRLSRESRISASSGDKKSKRMTYSKKISQNKN